MLHHTRTHLLFPRPSKRKQLFSGGRSCPCDRSYWLQWQGASPVKLNSNWACFPPPPPLPGLSCRTELPLAGPFAELKGLQLLSRCKAALASHAATASHPTFRGPHTAKVTGPGGRMPEHQNAAKKRSFSLPVVGMAQGSPPQPASPHRRFSFILGFGDSWKQ